MQILIATIGRQKVVTPYEELVFKLVWRNFSILSPKLVLAYAEDILSDSRLKKCAKFKGG